jgi:O-acetyl-ADP-ribose deacetylase (regulator of RNase III)
LEVRVMSKIIIKKGDIAQEDVDVIVNAANTKLAGGGGVDGAIHRAAGPTVLEECYEMGGCVTGESVITNAGKLKAKRIIHTPGPVYKGGIHGEDELLRNSYVNSFKLAIDNGLRTIAFPAISTGIYGYPIEEATYIAIEEGMHYMADFDEIRYICFNDIDYEVYQKVYKDLTQD